MTHPTIQFLEALGKQSVFIRSWLGKGCPDVPTLYKGKPGRAYNVRCDRSGNSLAHMRWDKEHWGRMVLELKRQNAPEYKSSKSFPFQDGGWVPYAIVNSGGHKKDEITECHAFFLEFDAPITKEEALLKLESFPLPVSALIDSRAGVHAYWFIDRSTTTKLWQQFQWRLIEFFESDKGIADYSRCMRLPGFYHLKEGAEPYLVTLKECHSERRYTLEQFDELLPEVPAWRLKLDRVSQNYERIRTEEGEAWDIRNFKHVLSHYVENSRREWDTCQCPVHARGDNHSTDSLHINNQTGAFHCWNDCDSKDIYKEVCTLAGWSRPSAGNKEPRLLPQELREAKAVERGPEVVESKQDQELGKAIDYHKVLDQVDLLETAIANDSELNWHVQNFAFDNELARRGFSGAKLLQFARARRDGSADIEVVDAHDILNEHSKPEYLIAGNLLKGVVATVAGVGGSGKTVLLYDFARNVAMGTPWSGYRTQQGRCLMVQADEPRTNIAQKLRIAKFRDVPEGMVKFITRWRFSQFRQLEKLVKEEEFSFVMIDSWTATHAGLGIDLTKSNAGDNAYRLRDLAEDTGATIVIVHHLNKLGELRDSSSLHDNVSDVWRLHKGKENDRLLPSQRILSIDKSRSDLMGDYLLEQNAADYSWYHLGPMENPDLPGHRPLISRLHDFLCANQGEQFSAKDLSERLDCDYGKADLELQRLFRQGLIESEWVAWNRPGHTASGFWIYHEGKKRESHPAAVQAQASTNGYIDEDF